MEHYQLAVIGGGPGGYTAALRAAALGIKTVLVEKQHLGGTCLNHGCIPTKTLNHSAVLYRKLKTAAEYGFTTGAIGFDYGIIQEHKAGVVGELVGRLAGLLKEAGVESCSGEAHLVSANRLEITTDGGGKRTCEADNVILATGSRETVPPVEGVDLPGVIYSQEALALRQVPQTLAVIGGGVIALEMATIFASFGSAVTIVQRSVILRREDREMARRLTPYLRRQGITLMTETKLNRIERDGDGLVLSVSSRQGDRRLEAKTVLVAVGRRPDFGGQDLDNLGISYSDSGIEVSESMETAVPGIYAVGDVTAPGYYLAHVAAHQGIVAAENVAGRKAVFRGDVVPLCIFTQPELARVGLTEEEARENGFSVKVGKFPFSANGKAFLQGEPDGIVKIITDAEKDTVLGLHILGPHASDLIQEGTLAVASSAKIEALANLIHPHPTLSETVWEAALAVNGAQIHFSHKG